MEDNKEEKQICKEKPLDWLLKLAIEENNGNAQYFLGIYYENEIEDKDKKQALEWYLKAASQEIGEAQYHLARDEYFSYEDTEESLYWLKKAAENGHVKSQYQLATHYKNGDYYSLSKDYIKAFYWYTKAAKQGHDVSQFMLYNCYTRGYGVEKNNEEAIKWLKKAADNKCSQAQYTLATLYVKGTKIPKDIEKATELFESIPKIGRIFKKAYMELGKIYEDALDFKKAYYNFQQAAEYQIKYAQERLEKYEITYTLKEE